MYHKNSQTYTSEYLINGTILANSIEEGRLLVSWNTHKQIDVHTLLTH